MVFSKVNFFFRFVFSECRDRRTHQFCQAYKAVFTSPSSAKDVERDGDGIDVILNNKRTKKSAFDIRVKKHVAQIIKMKKVTPRSIAYIACQVSLFCASLMIERA